MAKIAKKYQEDFEKLMRDWERLKQSPNSDHLNLVMQDLQQFQNDLRNMHF